MHKSNEGVGLKSEITLDQVTVPIAIHDMTRLKERLDAIRQPGASDADLSRQVQKMVRSGEFPAVFEMMDLLDINAAALHLWEAENREEVLANRDKIWLEESKRDVALKLAELALGVDYLELDTVFGTLSGQRVHIRIQCSVVVAGSRHLLVSSHTGLNDRVELEARLNRIQHRQKAAIEAARLGIWEVDVPRRRILFDANYHTLLGFEPGSLDGPVEILEQILHPEDLEPGKGLFQQLLRGECPFLERVNRLRLSDGSYRSFLCRGEVTECDDQGVPLCVVGSTVSVDAEVTSQKLLAIEGEVLGMLASDVDLHESLRQLCLGVESVWDQVRCAINLHDPENATLHFGAAPTLDSTYADFVEGFKVGELPTVCGLALERRELAYIADLSNAPPEFEVSLPFYAELGVSGCWSMPAHVGDQILATCCVFTLIPRAPSATEVIQLERLARTIGLLIEADRQKRQTALFEEQVRTKDRLESLGKLAGGIAHDFNNLLTAVLTNAELLALSDSAKTRDSAEQIRNAASLAAELCRKMLTYAGQAPFQLKPVNLNDVVEEMVDIIRSGSPTRIRFESDCHADIATILGDVSILSQLVLNLITNAVEAIEDFGTVVISTGEVTLDENDLSQLLFSESLGPGRYVCLRVSDNGVGIPTRIRQRIFDPFFSTKPEGRGLGLATVFGAVRRHNGGIAIESAPGEGSVFSVYLPPSGEALEGEVPGNSVESEARLRVVIVDDEPAVRRSLEHLLQTHGHGSIPFASGEAAIAGLERIEDCDVVLLDQQMPGVNGVETYREIRAAYSRLPVCFMSGYTASENVSQLVHSDSYCGFIGKPFTSDALLQKINELVGAATSDCPQPRRSDACFEAPGVRPSRLS